MMQRLLISLLTGTALLSADTLVLRDGTRIEGSFVGGDNHSVRFASGDQVRTYYLNNIEHIRFNANQGASNQGPGPAYGDNRGYQQGPPPSNYPPAQNSSYGNYSAPANNSGYGAEVPPGTAIVVRLIDQVNSETDRLGQTYRATVDQPVVVNGQTVIPRGSDVVAALVDDQQSGKIQGRTVLTLDLRSITVDNHTYNVVSTGVPEASGSRGARSAKVIGGTAALGAIIGAIAGGGRGAAIGAGSGAAVGTAAEVMTSGQKVKIPSETRLTFTLQNPLQMR